MAGLGDPLIDILTEKGWVAPDVVSKAEAELDASSFDDVTLLLVENKQLSEEQRAEALAIPRQDHHPAIAVVTGLLQRLPERHHDVEGHGVHTLRPVQCDLRDAWPRLVYQYKTHHRSLLRG